MFYLLFQTIYILLEKQDHYKRKQHNVKLSSRIQLVSSKGELIDELILHITFLNIDICAAPSSQIKKVGIIIILFIMYISNNALKGSFMKKEYQNYNKYINSIHNN